MAVYRILSLDGGGVRALLQVKALQALYPQETAKGHDVLEKFDLVAANGGGCVVLAGLLSNKPLASIVDEVFRNEKQRRQLFAPTPWFNLHNRLFRGTQYSTNMKLEGFRSILEEYAKMTLPTLFTSLRR